MSDDQATMIDRLHTRIQSFLDRDAAVYGSDLAPYSGHVHRVAELTALQVDMRPEWTEPLAVAATFHDAAIWFDRTWDYLPGSERLALDELTEPAFEPVVQAMVDEHHRVTHAHHPHPMVEAMRRADATDVYRVVMPPQVSRADYKDMLHRFPDAGFHAMLGRGFLLGLRERKRLNPMPMMKP